MSQWRRIALEQVPSSKKRIEEAENPMEMWIGLYSELQRAYEADPLQEEVIRQIYKYTFRCYAETKNEELSTAVVCAFFEHLPTHGKLRKDLPNRISRGEFNCLESIFHYFLDEDQFQKLKEQFMAAKDKQRK